MCGGQTVADDGTYTPMPEEDAVRAASDSARAALGLRNPSAAPVAEPAIPIALRQAWPIDRGEIEFIIRTDEALPPSIYVLVAKMAEVAEEMKRKLTGPYVEITTDNPPAAYRTHPAPQPAND